MDMKTGGLKRPYHLTAAKAVGVKTGIRPHIRLPERFGKPQIVQRPSKVVTQVHLVRANPVRAEHTTKLPDRIRELILPNMFENGM